MGAKGRGTRRLAAVLGGALLFAGCRVPVGTSLAWWSGRDRPAGERLQAEPELRRLAPTGTDPATAAVRIAQAADDDPAAPSSRVRLASFLGDERLESPDPALLAPSPWIEEVPAPELAVSPMGTEFTLEEAIQLTLQGNPDLASASARLSTAGALLDRARAEFYPKLGVSENYGVTNNPVYAFMYQLNQGNLSLTQDFNNPPTIDNFQTQVRLEHRVYAGEQRLHEEHAAEAGVSAAAQALQAVQNQLVYGVAEAYYRLMQARDLVEVRQEAVSQVEQHLEIVQSRFRNDTAVKSDVLTVQVRLAEVREALITAQNQLELAWAVLQNVTGMPIEPRSLPTAIPPAPWSETVDEIQFAIAHALSDRPEISASASQQLAAAESVEAARAGKRLGVDVVADYDLFTGDFLRGNDSFFVGLMFHLNLYDGGRTQAEVCRALARVRELQAEHRRLLLDIELEVRRSHLQLNDAQARLKVADETVGQAQESLREIEVRYQGQTATITELVDAQVALSNARVRRTNAQADVEIARVALQRALGRLTGLVY